jgi:hypothetical protein
MLGTCHGDGNRAVAAPVPSITLVAAKPDEWDRVGKAANIQAVEGNPTDERVWFL